MLPLKRLVKKIASLQKPVKEVASFQRFVKRIAGALGDATEEAHPRAAREEAHERAAPEEAHERAAPEEAEKAAPKEVDPIYSKVGCSRGTFSTYERTQIYQMCL